MPIFDALANPSLQPLWAAARKRLQGNGISLDGTPLVLRGLSQQQADAVAGLLGVARPGHGQPFRISLGRLDGSLRTSAAQLGLLEVLEHLGGQLRDLRVERSDALELREQRWSALIEHPLALADKSIVSWLEEVRRSGFARRLAGAEETKAVRVAMDALRLARTEVSLRLGVLAARVTGDSHALDRGRPAGSLAVHAVCWTGSKTYPEDAAAWRGIWAEAGVACDDLSCDVLVLRVPGWPDEPLRLTLRQIMKWDPPPANGSVFVCENPTVVSAAADLPTSSAVICVEGIPSTAAVIALDKLARQGRTIHYHGDFDWRGLAIAAVVFRKIEGSRPWRFGEKDYRLCVEAGLGTAALSGRAQTANWDPTLSQTMAASGVAIYEEQVLDQLLADIGH